MNPCKEPRLKIAGSWRGKIATSKKLPRLHVGSVADSLPNFTSSSTSSHSLKSILSKRANPTSQWQTSQPHTQASSLPNLTLPPPPRTSLPTNLLRPNLHRRNRRNGPPIPPRLHARRSPQPLNALGPPLLPHPHPNPQQHPHRLPLPPRPTPPTGTARGAQPCEYCGVEEYWREDGDCV